MTKKLLSALSMFAAIAFIAPLAHATSSVSSGTVTSIGMQPGSAFAVVAVSNATGSAPCGALGNYSANDICYAPDGLADGRNKCEIYDPTVNYPADQWATLPDLPGLDIVDGIFQKLFCTV